jgi:prevent-host-death family protein
MAATSMLLKSMVFLLIPRGRCLNRPAALDNVVPQAGESAANLAAHCASATFTVHRDEQPWADVPTSQLRKRRHVGTLSATMKLLSSREFNRDVSQAKRAAQVEPVLITDRGQPTHVLMSIAEYRRLTGEGESILELLALPEGVALEDGDASPDGAWDHREPLG